jgi:transcription elongation factor Elf1
MIEGNSIPTAESICGDCETGEECLEQPQQDSFQQLVCETCRSRKFQFIGLETINRTLHLLCESCGLFVNVKINEQNEPLAIKSTANYVG